MLDEVVQIAYEAGEKIMTFYKNKIEVQIKADDSPVSAADLAANAIIVKGLQALDPGCSIISEELPVPDFEIRKNWSTFWMLDPLDGTKEFLNHTDEFTVNIARLVKNQPVIGAVYAPARGLMYYGEVGKGAWKRVNKGPAVRIFSEPKEPSGPFRIIHSRSHMDEKTRKFVDTTPTSHTLSIGSSLKFGLLAEGAADIYPRFGPMSEWDVAAGDAVFRASGKSAPRKSPLQYNKSNLRVNGFILGQDWDLP